MKTLQQIMQVKISIKLFYYIYSFCCCSRHHEQKFNINYLPVLHKTIEKKSWLHSCKIFQKFWVIYMRASCRLQNVCNGAFEIVCNVVSNFSNFLANISFSKTHFVSSELFKHTTHFFLYTMGRETVQLNVSLQCKSYGCIRPKRERWFVEYFNIFS